MMHQHHDDGEFEKV